MGAGDEPDRVRAVPSPVTVVPFPGRRVGRHPAGVRRCGRLRPAGVPSLRGGRRAARPQCSPSLGAHRSPALKGLLDAWPIQERPPGARSRSGCHGPGRTRRTARLSAVQPGTARTARRLPSTVTARPLGAVLEDPGRVLRPSSVRRRRVGGVVGEGVHRQWTPADRGRGRRRQREHRRAAQPFGGLAESSRGRAETWPRAETQWASFTTNSEGFSPRARRSTSWRGRRA